MEWDSDDLQILSSLGTSQTDVLDLPWGDDAPNGHWKNLINTRLRTDGNYLFLQTRGGSDLLASFTGNILTVKAFSATIGGVSKKYIAVHTSAGHGYLYDIGLATTTTMFTATFRTTGQVEFIHSGHFLYIFDGGLNQYKVYDIKNSLGYNWIPGLGKSMQSYSWISGDWTTQENLWGMKEGAPILALHTFAGGSYVGTVTLNRSFKAFRTKVDTVFPGYFTYSTPDGVSYTSSSQGADIGFMPASADVVKAYEGAPSKFQVTADDATIANAEYQDPIIYRGYLIIDQMADGSFITPGRPITVASTPAIINTNKYLGVRLTTSAAITGVVKRYLYATRWQGSSEDAFTPTRPEYPNSPWFLVGGVEPGQTTIDDYTSDDKLVVGLAERFPLIAGVNQLFGAGQIEPITVASQKSSLIVAGYKMNRPTPVVYTDAANTAQGNAWYNQAVAGTALTDSPVLALQFEYAGGRNSPVVDTANVLTNGSLTLAAAVASTNAKVEFKCTSADSADGSLEVRLESLPDQAVSVNYLAADTIYDIIQKIITAVNAATIASSITASLTGSGDIVRFTWDAAGADGNDESMRIIWNGTIDFENSGSGQLAKPFTGGTGATGAVTRSGNQLTLHSLNALVSTVHVLVKSGGAYKYFKGCPANSAEFHGAVIYLPNSDAQVTALPAYTPPAAANIAASIDLPDHILPGVPLQELRVGEQHRLEGSPAIGKVIPWMIDSDKADIRYRILCFTDRNIQMGYLSFGSGQAFSVRADFEVVLEGIRATSFDGIASIGGSVFFQSKNTMFMYDPRAGLTPLFDVLRYGVSASNNPTDIIFNEDNAEIWFIYGNTEVIVYSLSAKQTRRMDYSVLGSVLSGVHLDGTVYICIGTGIYRTDLTTQSFDQVAGNVVTGQITTRHIGNPRLQSMLLEVIVTGNGGSVALDVDLQPERRESNAGVWDENFNTDVTFAAKDIEIHGASFYISRRAIMPRLRLRFSAGVIEDIAMRHVLTENRGKARQ